jgi:processive 1,2-diacylglycerol beta-glucosyltransferase
LSTAEALVAQVPMVLCKPLPGQEERNARVLVEAGAAVRTSQTSELPAVLECILGDKDGQAKMIAAARRLARPNAASDAASMITRLAQTDKEVVA